jgi:hypothetical protein
LTKAPRGNVSLGKEAHAAEAVRDQLKKGNKPD